MENTEHLYKYHQLIILLKIININNFYPLL